MEDNEAVPKVGELGRKWWTKERLSIAVVSGVVERKGEERRGAQDCG
jgi:hypothetical protein